MTSVLLPWVMHLPLREQGTLLTAVRGCDLTPKNPDEDRPERALVAFLRWCFMVPADSREVDVPGAFFRSTLPLHWKPSQFGHYPQHWYAHIMHAYEVVAYRHPDFRVSLKAEFVYLRFVHALHLQPESRSQFERRLSEDRIASGEVVS